MANKHKMDFKFSGFHRKTLPERQELIKALYPNIETSLFTGELSQSKANLMIENCIGMLPLPVGLAFYFDVNGKNYVVPMSVEEPSIIAAASNAAKLIGSYGGFSAACTPPIMIGQIQILDVNPNVVAEIVIGAKQELIHLANTKYCYRMRQRGGGVTDLNVKVLNEKMSVVELFINVCDAMGANLVNTVCEKVSHDILGIIGEGRTGLRILSNYCTERLVKASFKIPISSLGTKSTTGEIPGNIIAIRMLEALDFAKLDVYRATTHNKGIMNGVDSIAIATGQDFRAIEAAAHAWACRSGSYQPLTNYWILDDYFCGEIEMPMSLGTKGGVLNSNPIYSATFELLGYPSSPQLSELIACVGLACNFSAIKAMVTDGIQKGHMSLHARNIALAAGVPEALVQEVVEYMKNRDDISVSTANDYMKAHDLHASIRRNANQQMSLSTLYVDLPELTPHVKINIAFQCPELPSVHLSIEQSERIQTDFQAHIKDNLLGGSHSHTWVLKLMRALSQVSYQPPNPRLNSELRQTLKLLGVLASLATTQLAIRSSPELIEAAFGIMLNRDISELHAFVKRQEAMPHYVAMGLYLVKELFQIFTYHIDSATTSAVSCSSILARELKYELKTVLLSNLKAYTKPELPFEVLVKYHQKQMCATLMFLVDGLGTDTITQTLIVQLRNLGEVVELLSTTARDLKKVQDGVLEKPNIYLSWLAQNNAQDSDLQRMAFVKIVGDLMEEARTALVNSPYTEYLDRAAETLQSYYHLNAKL